MKKNVVYSSYSWIITSVITAVLAGMAIYFTRRDDLVFCYIFLGCLAALILCSMYYAPVTISADNMVVSVSRLVRTRKLPISEMTSVKLCPPTMGEKRLFGSGGFLGYWGWFSERDLGRYFAYYGKASDCFFVKMRDGRQYMLGCDGAAEMVEYIKSSPEYNGD